MRIKITIFILLLCLITLFSCNPYQIPNLSLDLKSVYTKPDITVNYTYVCEYTYLRVEKEQRCVYSLVNKALPSEIIAEGDELLPWSGQLHFSGLAEGDYRLHFSVYSERDGVYSLLTYLDESYDFSVDLP